MSAVPALTIFGIILSAVSLQTGNQGQAEVYICEEMSHLQDLVLHDKSSSSFLINRVLK